MGVNGRADNPGIFRRQSMPGLRVKHANGRALDHCGQEHGLVCGQCERDTRDQFPKRSSRRSWVVLVCSVEIFGALSQINMAGRLRKDLSQCVHALHVRSASEALHHGFSHLSVDPWRTKPLTNCNESRQSAVPRLVENANAG